MPRSVKIKEEVNGFILGFIYFRGPPETWPLVRGGSWTCASRLRACKALGGGKVRSPLFFFFFFRGRINQDVKDVEGVFVGGERREGRLHRVVRNPQSS